MQRRMAIIVSQMWIAVTDSTLSNPDRQFSEKLLAQIAPRYCQPHLFLSRSRVCVLPKGLPGVVSVLWMHTIEDTTLDKAFSNNGALPYNGICLGITGSLVH
eukprot:5456210-Amphidinium_carterae.2